MKQSFFAIVFVALVAAVFLTYRYDASAKANVQTVATTPAAMMGQAGACPNTANCSGCPYAHTASMQSGQCPYGAQCTDPAVCSHPGSTMGSTTMAGMAPQVVPVVAKTVATKSDKNCPPCPACPGQ